LASGSIRVVLPFEIDHDLMAKRLILQELADILPSQPLASRDKADCVWQIGMNKRRVGASLDLHGKFRVRNQEMHARGDLPAGDSRLAGTGA
jgi:hypothetical protein